MKELQILPDETIINKIYIIRDKKVMIDRDLAELYGVDTRVLNQTVKRNLKRFPEDFMFQMTREELENWKSQIVISNVEKMGIRKLPLVFTEQGVAMLSSVLTGERAISVNIQIIRVFTRMRTMIGQIKVIKNALSIICSFFARPRTSYFLCLDTKKVTKERSRLQIILGLSL